MGVDYYNCCSCNAIYSTCGDFTQCDICNDSFCGDCKVTTKLEAKCDGQCAESTGWVDPDKKLDYGGCTCADVVKNFREATETDERIRVCDKCLTVKNPYKVTKSDIIKYFLESTKKSKREVIEEIKNERKKQRSA